MNITSKSRYALKIMMDLAEHRDGDVVHRGDIASRQGIPLDYMDHILSRLREAGLIDSTRGRGGGYRLLMAADEISVHAILSAVEDAYQPVQCLDGGSGCIAEHVCHAKDAWGRISGAIQSTLSGIILIDLVTEKGPTPRTAFGDTAANAPQACRAPRGRTASARER